MKKRSREEDEEQEEEVTGELVWDPNDADAVDDEEKEEKEEGAPSKSKKRKSGDDATAAAPAAPATAAPGSLQAIYGEGAAASVELKPELAHGLKLANVHELVTWVMTDHGANPRWAFVRNKPLVSRVVLLLVPGLDFTRCAASAELMPNMRSALGRGRVALTPGVFQIDGVRLGLHPYWLPSTGCVLVVTLPVSDWLYRHYMDTTLPVVSRCFDCKIT
jgi:hypothetical protein